MNGSSDFSSKDDADLIAQAQRDQLAVDAAAAAETPPEAETPATPPPAAPAPAPTPAPPEPAPATTEAPAPEPAPPAPAPAEGQGDVKAALRAARHAERQARIRAEQLAAENEELRKKVPNTPALPVLDEKLKTDLQNMAPEAIAALEARDAEIARLQALVPPPAAPAKTFAPEVIESDTLQAAVEAVPELYEWQHSADHQDAWDAAKQVDGFLHGQPAWKGKPIAERLAEAVRIVKAQNPQLANPAPAPAVDPAKKAKELIDALPVNTTAARVGDLNSGENAHVQTPDYHRMAKTMTDEQIMATLGPH